jgi:hypothetical protein
VNSPKNIIPNIIGLMIEPRIKPKRIHNLFSGNKSFGLVIVSIKKNKASDRKSIAKIMTLKK